MSRNSIISRGMSPIETYSRANSTASLTESIRYPSKILVYEKTPNGERRLTKVMVPSDSFAKRENSIVPEEDEPEEEGKKINLVPCLIVALILLATFALLALIGSGLLQYYLYTLGKFKYNKNPTTFYKNFVF